MTSTGGRPAFSLDEGRLHLVEGRWRAAKAAFETALAQAETPEGHEGLSWAAWWLDEPEVVFAARERAFRLYRREERPADAARMAIWLAVDHLDFRSAVAVAGGWLRRADRLLEPLPPTPEHGWLAFNEGYLAYAAGDPGKSADLASRAREVGRRFDVPDLEMLGLGLEGMVRVSCAEVEPGMRLLDEATAAALSGEASIPISSAWTCCFLVSACEQVRDFPRAFQWCDEIAAFARRYGSRYMLGFCRAHYGLVHLYGGRWHEAEADLTGAVEAYSASRPALVPVALVALAELRRRQGRAEEAEALLDEADGGSASALLCHAHLALDRGEALRAAELAERALRQVAEHCRMERAPALELLVRAHAQRRDLSAAGRALEALEEIRDSAGTPLLRAAVDLASGALEAAAGDHASARRRLEDATDGFERNGAPFEAAQARVELARTLVALGRKDAAEREGARARDAFVELGAAGEAGRARRILDVAVSTPEQSVPLPQLTPREREVLRQVAEGLTNREVARRLSISEHTVHRHVTNLLGKLGLSSRAAAAALAAREGLLDEPRG